MKSDDYDEMEVITAHMRGQRSIEEKAEELFERVWYMRHMGDRDWDKVPSDIRETAFKKAEEVRQKYADRKGWDGSPLLESDQKYAGTLQGWLGALRWVLDDTADETTDWIYDS
jgi:hypothetical protein